VASGLALAITQENLQAAVARLIAAFDPEEVILFGSRARGTARPDSDMDLVVVLRAGTVPPDERGLLAWKAVRGDFEHPGVIADVFPYTPEELRQSLARGSTVVRDALAEGVLLYPHRGGRSRYAELAKEWSRLAAVQEWLQYAEDALDDAEALLSRDHPVWRNVAYLAHQAAEKALKALILHLSGPLHRTHDIMELMLAVADLNKVVGKQLLLSYGNAGAELTAVAVEPRYPGNSVTEDVTRRAVGTARGIVEAVRRQIHG